MKIFFICVGSLFDIVFCISILYFSSIALSCPLPPQGYGQSEGIGNTNAGSNVSIDENTTMPPNEADGSSTNFLDSDGDGTPDNKDGCATDPNKFFPGVCGCGTADKDSDGDGTPDCNDQCGNDSKKVEPGVCGCNMEDTDSDGDGTADCNDQCKNDPNKTEPGVCGCNIDDADTDSDGTADCNDDCASDPNKTEPGECGCGIADNDANANGIADCKEPKDSDGDGIPDDSDDCPTDPAKAQPGECGCGISDADANVNGVPDCKESQQRGCASDAQCPQGYVCNSQSGHCVDPFDENYSSQNDLLDNKERDRQEGVEAQNIADANLNPDRGEFSSEGLEEDLDDIQKYISAECNERKPCSNGHVCVDGHCEDADHSDDDGGGHDDSDEEEAGHDCRETGCADGTLVCDTTTGECREKDCRLDGCSGEQRCDENSGKCRNFDCRLDGCEDHHYRCDENSGECVKKPERRSPRRRRRTETWYGPIIP